MAYFTLYASRDQSVAIDKILTKAMLPYEVIQQEDHFIIVKKGFIKKKPIARIQLKERLENEGANQFTNGFVGYIIAEVAGDQVVKDNLVRQASHTTTIISFDIMEQYIEEFWGSFIETTSMIGGLILLPSSIILDGSGEELVDENNKIMAKKFTATITKQQVAYETTIEATIENQGRRQASQVKLSANKIPYIDALPLLPDSKMVQRRSTVDVAKRASIIIIMIQFVRELLDDEEKTAITTAKRMSEVFLNRYGVKMNLTNDEQLFLEKDHFDNQELINRMWLYEAAWVMLWSIGLLSELKEPTEICDVDALLQLITDNTNVSEIVAEAQPVTTTELLDRMDENYLYHWSCIENRMNGIEAPADLDEGVIMERQRAFNWLIALHDEPWDDITLNA
ncbi:DUF4272 domain-containing protein [Kurthia sibirica]|nr:DUF4272 domain-containing protein [Kurthia sibirica]GEK33012.1 hypothetical protein KSI01_05450 [Kurthia sibirica]